jgi:hypothetical protein
MAPAKPGKPRHATAADTTEAVDAFMKRLDHPHKAAIEALRKVVIDAAPGIREGIKWNSPSFRTTEYFATANLREKAGIGLILHLGAKVRALPAGGIAIADSACLLKWLGKDRAMIVFKDAEQLAERKAALAALVREWISHV